MATIDLSQLPAPDVVEKLDYESLFEERKTTLISLYPADQQESISRTLTLESEPLVKLLQENAYRELILRQRVNEAARAVMVPYATGSDLDQLAANFNVQRLILQAADNTTIPSMPAIMETDSDLRMRIPHAFEGLSVAGPTGAYEYHARSADGRVADASAISPSPSQVTVTILSRDNNGSASDDLLQTVEKALNDEDVRPVADRVTVQTAEIVPYHIDAVLYVLPTPEIEPVRAASEAQLKTYINMQSRLGRDIRLSAIYAALHVEGVQRVELSSPLADIVLDKTQASLCTSYSLTVGGSDE